MNLVWFHNDLRTSDNHSLLQACRGDSRVIAVYCFDPQYFQRDAFGFQRTGPFRARFLQQSLRDLRAQLHTLNITLMIRNGAPAEILPSLVLEYGITDIYRQREWTRDERRALEQAFAQPEMQRVQLHEYYDQFLLHPDDLPFKSIAEIPPTFTDFRRHCEQAFTVHPQLPAPPSRPPRNLVHDDHHIPSLADLSLAEFQPDSRSVFPFEGGSGPARARIKHYFWRSLALARHKQTRNGLLGVDCSSKLSPWLANGCLSPREVYWQVKAFERDVLANEDTHWLVRELLRRDYFKYISLQYGDRFFQPGGLRGEKRVWQRDPQVLQQWTEGRTQYDFVNANMREIAATGWMSNRGRKNVASYWAREMGQDWRIGAAWFESLLIDHDVHSNYGNWLYLSGLGNDPRDRHIDIEAQAERYDPDGSYRRLWLTGDSGD